MIVHGLTKTETLKTISTRLSIYCIFRNSKNYSYLPYNYLYYYFYGISYEVKFFVLFYALIQVVPEFFVSCLIQYLQNLFFTTVKENTIS